MRCMALSSDSLALEESATRFWWASSAPNSLHKALAAGGKLAVEVLLPCSSSNESVQSHYCSLEGPRPGGFGRGLRQFDGRMFGDVWRCLRQGTVEKDEVCLG